MRERYQRIYDGLSPWQKAWVNLDYKLTERPNDDRDTKLEEILSQIHHQPKDLNEWYRSHLEYYLSDGGYSRVGLDELDWSLYLTSNSRDQVKARWELAKAEREAVEALVRQQVKEMYGEEANDIVERKLGPPPTF